MLLLLLLLCGAEKSVKEGGRKAEKGEAQHPHARHSPMLVLLLLPFLLLLATHDTFSVAFFLLVVFVLVSPTTVLTPQRRRRLINIRGQGDGDTMGEF